MVDGHDADPTTFYVSPDLGSDDASGQTPNDPWQSLQFGFDQAQPGQTIYLLDGEYRGETEPGRAHYVMFNSGTRAEPITIAAAPGHQPTLIANAGNGLSIRGDFVTVDGLTVRGENFDADNSYGWGILIRESHHVRVLNSEVSDMAVGGISSVESSSLEIAGNTIYGNSFWGTEQGSGISMWHSADHGQAPDADGYHDRIVGNIVYRNENKVFSRWSPDVDLISDGNGIIIDQSQETGFTGRTLVANNVVFDNGGRGIMVHEAARVDIMFNTTYHNGRTADLSGGPVELSSSRSFDVRILNNVAWGRSEVGPIQSKQSTDVETGGNVVITDIEQWANYGVTNLDTVRLADPGLAAPSLNPEEADFRPNADSVLVGQALESHPWLGFDANGNQRVAGAATVGAFELAN